MNILVHMRTFIVYFLSFLLCLSAVRPCVFLRPRSKVMEYPMPIVRSTSGPRPQLLSGVSMSLPPW